MIFYSPNTYIQDGDIKHHLLYCKYIIDNNIKQEEVRKLFIQNRDTYKALKDNKSLCNFINNIPELKHLRFVAYIEVTYNRVDSLLFLKEAKDNDVYVLHNRCNLIFRNKNKLQGLFG